MEFYTILGLPVVVVVMILILFACSITKFLNQLPKCQKTTRKAIDCTIVRMGYFINFKRNVNILSNRIKEFPALIQELEASNESQAYVQSSIKSILSTKEKAVEVNDEARRIMNGGWHRRWNRSCYQLSTRVAAMISGYELMLDHDVGIPGIAFVFLIAYSLTNAILHLPKSTTTKADVIDWIVIEMVYPLKLKNYLKKLRDGINLMNIRRSCIENNPAKKHLEMLIGYNSILFEEAQLVCDEGEHMIKYWYKGWTGSRSEISKRAEKAIKSLRRKLLKGGGRKSRNIISSIDEVSKILPGAITAIRHYLYFDANVELLVELIIEHPAQDELSAEAAQRLAKELELLEEAQLEGLQLIQQAQLCFEQQWYKMWPTTRYRLHKRLAKIAIHITRLDEEFRSKLYQLQMDAM